MSSRFDLPRTGGDFASPLRLEVFVIEARKKWL